MKKFTLQFLLYVSTLLICYSANAQCLPNGITLKSQAEVNSFPSDYPGCTHILGDLIIDSDPLGRIADLSPLSQITRVDGKLSVYDATRVTNLQGLQNITYVGGDVLIWPGRINDISALSTLDSIGGGLEIRSSDLDNLTGLENIQYIPGDVYIGLGLLTDFKGLDQLREVGGKFEIISCNSLVNLQGLDSLRIIEGGFEIEWNNLLVNLQGLHSIERVGFLYFYSNPALQNLRGLENLRESTNGISLGHCDALKDVQGLDSLQRMGSFGVSFCDNFERFTGLENIKTLTWLNTRGCGKLTSFEGFDALDSIRNSFTFSISPGIVNFKGLENLKYIGEDFQPHNNASLVNFEGLENLNTIGGQLSVVEDSALVSCKGLENLRSVGGRFEFRSLPLLTDVQALINLQRINGDLMIRNNVKLTSLKGLDNIDYSTIEDVFIRSNTLLSDCRIQSICDHVEFDFGNNSFQTNAVGCSRIGRVQLECATISIDPEEGEKSIRIGPNPTDGLIQVYEFSAQSPVQYQVLDRIGKVLLSGTLSNDLHIDLTDLPTGIYLLNLQSDVSMHTTRIIRQ